MDSYKCSVKFFVENPSGLRVEEFVPVFHRWIQDRALRDHQLIDVADYKHVHEGPGTVLVSHEANIHADLAEGKLGLLYFRKQPLPGLFHERLRAVFGYALRAAVMLEDEKSLNGGLRFRTDNPVFRIHDRLHAPNTPQTFEQVQGELETFLSKLYGESSVALTHQPSAESLFEVRIQAPRSVPVATLLDRVGNA